MSITLTVGATTLPLHADLQWVDEHGWNPVEQRVERSLTGALVIDVMTRLHGRPITLQPEDDRSAWMARSVVDQLQSWADAAGQQMTLNLRGTNYTVVWRHHEPPALAAKPVLHYSDVDSADRYLVTLKLMVVS